MSLLRSFVVISGLVFLSSSVVAGVYKCTDELGNTAYQSAPCAAEKSAAKVNVKTGSLTDLSIAKKELDEAEKLKQKAEAELKQQQALEASRIKQAKHQSTLNQQLIQNNPIQFTAFAIPPYWAESLSETVKPFASRLPDIEKFRRMAAQKALATGECQRVESDELSINSTLKLLVFSIDCSSAKTFQYNETELAK